MPPSGPTSLWCEWCGPGRAHDDETKEVRPNMRIRQRLIGLLVGMLSLGAVVAMFPSGSEAASKNVQASSLLGQTTTCATVKTFVATEKSLVSLLLTGQVKTQYLAKLNQIQSTACTNGGASFTCTLVQSLIADLRAIRGNLLGPLEPTLQALENTILQLVCSS